MKKTLGFLLAALLFSSVVWAEEWRREVDLRVKGTCRGTSDLKLKLRVAFPGGFPTWANMTTGEIFPNPSLIQINQIQAMSLELIHEGGVLDFIQLERGKDWFDKNGKLVVKAAVCMPPNTIMQILVTGSLGRYQLAIDNPAVERGIDEIFSFGAGCGFSQLRDGTWGIACER